MLKGLGGPIVLLLAMLLMAASIGVAYKMYAECRAKGFSTFYCIEN